MILRDFTYAAMPGGWEMVVIAIVILLLFGAKKLPELARGMGKAMKEFKKATKEVEDDIKSAMEEEPEPPRKRNPESKPAQTEPVVAESEETQPTSADSEK